LAAWKAAPIAAVQITRVRKRPEDAGGSLDEPLVKVYHSQEPLHAFGVLWPLELGDGCHLLL
jgi:hypothetical protein